MTVSSNDSTANDLSTTHDPRGGGEPHLVLAKQDMWEGEGQPVFWLGRPTTTIGSDSSCDIVLPDVAPLHAVVAHDEADEYVLESCGPETRVHGAVVEDSQVLRTGARIEIGLYCLVFAREEQADHGRPYGGREGGELGHQRSQPPRPSFEAPSPGR